MELADPFAGLPFQDLVQEERMVAEYRMLRFSASLHPLALVRDQLPRGTIASGQLKDLPNGSPVRLAGIVVARQRPQTAKGYVFVLFEDEDGPINVIVKPPIYERDRSIIRMEPFVTVRGRLQKDGETLNVIAQEVEALEVRALRGGASRGGAGNGGALKAGSEVRVPETREWWGKPEEARKSPFAYLTALRQSPPGTRSWG
jgi:DNA polymerase III alpha subunit